MDQKTDFFKGAMMGGLLGGVVGLLVAPKSGRELREDIVEGYHAINDKAHCISEDLRERGNHLLHVFQEEEEEMESGSHTSLIVGATLGLVIGTVAALLLAPQTGNKLRSKLGNRYEEIRDKAEDFVTNFNDKGSKIIDQMDDWKDTLAVLVDKFATKKGRQPSKINEIADWAGLGIRLYQQMQSRR